MNYPPRSLPLAVLAAAFLLSASFFVPAQGPLIPPGAPAAVMKTLQQIEPRTDLQATPAPAGVDVTNASYHFIINQPGSYYLSANLGATKLHGIQINAENVTLDLNGFEISRASGSGGNGIEIPATSHRAAVRNGSLKGFLYGIRSLLTAPSFYAKGCAFRDLAASGCGTAGILAGDGAVLEACRAHGNSGAYGISAFTGSTLSQCTAFDNTATFGIYVQNGSTLSHCTASGNTGDGIYAVGACTLNHCTASGNAGFYGILANDGPTLSHCTANGNTGGYGIYVQSGCTLSHCAVSDSRGSGTTSAGIGTGVGSVIMHCTVASTTSTAATSTPTTGMGFQVGANSTIEGCTAYANEGDGIYLASGTLALANTCIQNGNLGDGAGIHATGGVNRIEANNVNFNDRGIDVDVARNIILKNSASSNPINYAIAANNVFGAIVDRNAPASAAVSGSSAASSAGTTDPWANFAY